MPFIIALVILGLVIAAFLFYIYRETERDKREVMEKGQPFIAYILIAHQEIREPARERRWEHGCMARLLIAFEPESPELHAALQALVTRLEELRMREPLTDGERAVISLVRDPSFVGGRIPLPAELTDGRVAYSHDGYIERALLPKGWLVLPYVHCKAVPGDKGNIYMLPYPDKESAAKCAEKGAVMDAN
jgi:hypothetical protein